MARFFPKTEARWQKGIEKSETEEPEEESHIGYASFKRMRDVASNYRRRAIDRCRKRGKGVLDGKGRQSRVARKDRARRSAFSFLTGKGNQPLVLGYIRYVVVPAYCL